MQKSSSLIDLRHFWSGCILSCHLTAPEIQNKNKTKNKKNYFYFKNSFYNFIGKYVAMNVFFFTKINFGFPFIKCPSLSLVDFGCCPPWKCGTANGVGPATGTATDRGAKCRSLLYQHAKIVPLIWRNGWMLWNFQIQKCATRQNTNANLNALLFFHLFHFLTITLKKKIKYFTLKFRIFYKKKLREP